MVYRTTQRTIIIDHAFTVDDCSKPLPAGRYEIAIDEEIPDKASPRARQRVLIQIRVPATLRKVIRRQWLTISPGELDQVLDPVGTRPETKPAASRSGHALTPTGTSFDRRAIDRAEDEGMYFRAPDKLD
jgi:hypothetical protein